MCRLARRAPEYTVETLPTWWQLTHAFAAAGLHLRELDHARVSKLTRPELIHSPGLRFLVALLLRLRLAGLVTRLVNSAAWRSTLPPVWQVVASKRAPAPTEAP